MSITINTESKIFYLDGKNITYAFFVNENGYLEHLYYGKQIGKDDIRLMRRTGTGSFIATIPGIDLNEKGVKSYHHFPSELSFFGTGDYRESAIMLTHSNGDRLVELLYDSHEILAEKPSINGMQSVQEN